MIISGMIVLYQISGHLAGSRFICSFYYDSDVFCRISSRFNLQWFYRLKLSYKHWCDDHRPLNRYRRGLETCPHAKTSKSGHAIFFSFSDASERRLSLSTESKILASTFGRFRLYRLNNLYKPKIDWLFIK